mmetsp:Transcript_21465/g.59802  ORF Transcript_21465/g.59802 Transcript_21465/m.59802 type:complete len:283 (-) Transcript_21465:10-858(-)
MPAAWGPAAPGREAARRFSRPALRRTSAGTRPCPHTLRAGRTSVARGVVCTTAGAAPRPRRCPSIARPVWEIGSLAGLSRRRSGAASTSSSVVLQRRRTRTSAPVRRKPGILAGDIGVVGTETLAATRRRAEVLMTLPRQGLAKCPSPRALAPLAQLLLLLPLPPPLARAPPRSSIARRVTRIGRVGRRTRKIGAARTLRSAAPASLGLRWWRQRPCSTGPRWRLRRHGRQGRRRRRMASLMGLSMCRPWRRSCEPGPHREDVRSAPRQSCASRASTMPHER